jgi:predicted acyltransferase
MSIAASSGSRIVSMDQFRGYTVAGMMFVNFLGDYAVMHPVFRHHNTYFSYADSIMPSFHFCVGFAFRLTLLRRLQQMGPLPTYWHFIRRNLGLILLSVVLSPIDHHFKTWEALTTTGVWGALAAPLKCEFWETLAIIGVTSIWVLPVMARSAGVRIVFVALCLLVHTGLCALFYCDFMWAKPNWLDQYWGATHVQGLDGGPFGFLAWALPQIVGSLAYDAVAASGPGKAFGKLASWGALLMIVAYGLSCLTTLYLPAPDQKPSDDRPASERAGLISTSFWPPTQGLASRDARSFLAEPPFVSPPKGLPVNNWMMSKRLVSLPFNLFATGFALFVYALFVLLCDVGNVRIGVFRILGQNPLAAYIIHELVSRAVEPFAPRDSPLAWVILAFLVFTGITLLFVRHLEKNGIFLRM